MIRARARNPALCADPFCVVELAGEALDTLRAQEAAPAQDPGGRRTRFFLRRRADSLSKGERTLVEVLAETSERVYGGWLLCDQLRAVYDMDDPSGRRCSSRRGCRLRARASSGLRTNLSAGARASPTLCRPAVTLPVLIAPADGRIVRLSLRASRGR